MAAPSAAPAEDPAAGSAPERPGRRALEVLVPVVLVLVAGTLLFGGVDTPERIYFDETYYVQEARDLLARGVEGSFTVHPPVGKWVIAGGLAVFGDTPLGWRAGPALAGTLTVLVVYLVGLRLFGRPGLAGVAALLVAVDGLAFTMSRIAMLDGILMLWVALGFLLLLVDRDRQWEMLPEEPTDGSLPSHPQGYRWAAGVVFGLAVATKWSGVLALGAAGLFLVGSELAWRRRLAGRALHRPWPATASILATLVVVPAAVYLLSYAGWFANLADTRLGDRLCPEGVCELSLSEQAGAWWGEQQAIYRFHRDLTAEHPYRSTAARWPLLQRPVAYYYESCPEDPRPETVCVVAEGKVAEILGIGNPAIWWLAVPAYGLVGWWALGRRDWRAAAIGVFLAGQYVPWLATTRPLFLFYMTPAVPFICLALTYAAARLARRSRLVWLPAAVVTLAVAAFLFFYPVLAGLELGQDAWQLRIWFDSWI